ncbi:hypothetical protein K0651_01835 [Ornithinimicrobium sp. Arc0846-15]|nr:hypothetical protein [Ornithinimicrobium laminariae]
MTPALSGQRANGSRVLPRECAWPIHLYSDGSSEEWAARDQAWWASLDRDVPGVWRVTAAGRSREITLRFDESEDNFVRDPMFFGWSPYSVRLIADDPWWYGPWVSRQFDNGTQVAPFHAGPQGAVIHIGSSSQLSSASIDNPGDEPSYLVYLLHGPFESATVGIGGQSGPVTSYVGQVPDGQTVVIDTRPGAPSRAYMVARPTSTTGSKDWVNQWSNQTGQSVYSGLTSIAMNYPLQAGKQSPLSLQMVGAGSVEVVHRPPYRRAW